MIFYSNCPNCIVKYCVFSGKLWHNSVVTFFLNYINILSPALFSRICMVMVGISNMRGSNTSPNAIFFKATNQEKYARMKFTNQFISRPGGKVEQRVLLTRSLSKADATKGLKRKYLILGEGASFDDAVMAEELLVRWGMGKAWRGVEKARRSQLQDYEDRQFSHFVEGSTLRSNNEHDLLKQRLDHLAQETQDAKDKDELTAERRRLIDGKKLNALTEFTRVTNEHSFRNSTVGRDMKRTTLFSVSPTQTELDGFQED